MSLGVLLASIALALQSVLKIHGGLFAAKICALGVGYARQAHARREIAGLAEMSAVQLRDIGLTRADIRAAEIMPSTADQTASLRHRRANLA
jgi:uncharacterized protein YjiS (DUF1127 family)